MIDTEPVELQHTYGQKQDGRDECPLCSGPHGGPGPCDHIKASRKRRRFDMVPWHREEILSALLNPDRSASSAVTERQDEEYRNLAPGHICMCICRNVLVGRMQCDECRMFVANQKPLIPIEIGRTAAVEPPCPSPATLDLLLGLL